MYRLPRRTIKNDRNNNGKALEAGIGIYLLNAPLSLI